MTKRRHAEIAGAGFAGLAAAAALGQRGWSVRVHEMNPELRAFGRYSVGELRDIPYIVTSLPIGPTLREKGQVFVGIDVIGDWLTEINVTSPTGIQELERFDGTNAAARIWQAIEAKRA